MKILKTTIISKFDGTNVFIIKQNYYECTLHVSTDVININNKFVIHQRNGFF